MTTIQIIGYVGLFLTLTLFSLSFLTRADKSWMFMAASIATLSLTLITGIITRVFVL